MNKLEKDKTYIWHPFNVIALENNVLIKKANGAHLHTIDGKKIIDAVSSWWVNIHGHRNKHIAGAVAKQLRYLEHVIFSGFTHEPAIKLAEGLVNILPGNMSKIFFSDDGSTSVEVALKMAIQYWHNQGTPKRKIIALDGAYHGDTFGAMSVGARDGFNKPFEPFLFDVAFIDFPANESSESILARFKALAAEGDVAAFIYEPLVQGSAGMRMYPADVLEKLLQIARQHHIICIADEVMTGFGRTGKNFASEYCETKPDIMCLSKGLTGGFLPMGVTACHAGIYEAFNSKTSSKIFLHGHSYTANPLACAAAVESLRLLLSSECRDHMRRVSAAFEAWIPQLSETRQIKNIRHLGCIIAFEVETDTATAYFNPLRDRLYHAFLDKNILLRPLGNVLYVMPPYIISDKDLNYILKSIKEVISGLESET